MLHQLIRYRPVIQKLKKEKYARVLEIGSGCHGITKFHDVRVHGVDINFKDYTSRRQELSPDLVPTIASAESLPFKDGEFDLVFSCDMLEHVPADKRSRAISEMVRVARNKVIVIFPCGRAALACDRALNSLCLLLGKAAPGWLTEHLDLDFPTRNEALSIIKGLGLGCSVSGNASIPIHYMALVAESAGGLKKFFSEVSTHGKNRPKGRGKGLASVIVKALLVFADLWPTYRIMVEIDKPSGGGGAA